MNEQKKSDDAISVTISGDVSGQVAVGKGITQTQTIGAARPEAAEAGDRAEVPTRYDTNTIRQLLHEALDDEGLTALCYDYFRDVYEAFAAGMSKYDKVQNLIEYCDRQGQLDKLLDQVRQLNPYQYEQFRSQLDRA
jgi:hypothetical protein